MGILLNKIADILIIALWFICNILGSVIAINKGEYKQWNENKARAKDLYGNVLIKYLADLLLITKESQFKFGNPKEYISYVIGKNKIEGTLTYLGCVVDGVLDFFDPGHTLTAAGLKLEIKKTKFNKMFFVYVSIINAVVFGVSYSIFELEWMMYFVYASYAYLIIIGSIMIIYAFLINPIKYLQNKHNKNAI